MSEDVLVDGHRDSSIPIIPLAETALRSWLETQPPEIERWTRAVAFRAAAGTHCLVADGDGALHSVLAGVADPTDTWSLSALAASLPPGNYHLPADTPSAVRERIGLGWALGTYRYDRYRTEPDPNADAPPVLALGDAHALRSVQDAAAAIGLVRDLINTPADALPPAALAAACQALADEFGATCSIITGDALLEKNFPAVHAVGRASAQAPCLIEMHWGDPAHPRVAIVGKGVCFDSGGLDIKPASGMRLMKKDMGGAAHAMGVARLIMSASLPVRLQLIVPAVENAIAGNAYRPGDVVATRRGLTVEIDNTDAEGRVILGDALALASESEPALIVDFATLTGAARVALGTDLPAMFTDDDALAAAIARHGQAVDDPVWRMPLHKPYRELIKSNVADILNAGKGPYAGAITAALFLQRFVDAPLPWVHFDLMAWNTLARPGRPEGGEAMGMRAVFAYLSERFAG